VNALAPFALFRVRGDCVPFVAMRHHGDRVALLSADEAVDETPLNLQACCPGTPPPPAPLVLSGHAVSLTPY